MFERKEIKTKKLLKHFFFIRLENQFHVDTLAYSIYKIVFVQHFLHVVHLFSPAVKMDKLIVGIHTMEI